MADNVVGFRAEFDASDGIKSIKDLKNSIKEARGDLIAMTEKFGATSDAARQAAKRVAELEDNLGDAKQLVDSFNPDKKFVALGQALNGVLGGFTALTGAMGLLGVESEEVQKQLLKVQSALALSQGLNQIGDSINSFKNLGKTIVDTFGKSGAIGIAIAGVAALGVAIWQTLGRNKQLEEAQKEYNKTLISARIEVAKVQDAFRQARMGLISKDEALKQYNGTLGQTIGQAKSLNEAEKLTADNANNYIKVQGLKAKANYLLAESAKISGEAELARLNLATNPTLQAASFGLLDGKIAEGEKKAKDIENIVIGIEGKIKTLSSGFKTPGAAGGTATTPAGAIKEKEVQEVDYYEALFARRQREAEIKELELKNIHAAELKAIDDKRFGDYAASLQQLTATEEQQADARIKISEAEAEAKRRTAQLIGSTLMTFSDLVGRETAAGKVLAIASATINTYLAATQALKADYSVYGPAAQFARVFAVASTIALGLKQVKEIARVQVPGKGSGGGSVAASASAPLQPQSPGATRTRLEQDQINQIGNATVRAFVVESDVTNNQERIRRLNRAARI